ncbi:MAG TPA: S26 family signal peptidase [Thermoplasmata archaeon]|nr:S26 family signal peptidase [Thermoplasmata archaeon]
MRRRSSEDDEPEPEDGDEEPDDEPSGPPRNRTRLTRARRALRPWNATSKAPPPSEPPDRIDEESEDSEEPPPGLFHRVRAPVFFRARDTVWFEPLVALAIVVLILVSLYAYTTNWPPAYVIESDSMQHGATDQVGLINTGDLVLAQRVNASLVTPYFPAESSGYRTYGEYGDVILYHPNGDPNQAPIIHRAILSIEYDASNHTYSIPALSGLACGNAPGAAYRVAAHLSGCGATGVTGELTLYGVGWTHAIVNISLTQGVLGAHSGFLTMGDNNYLPGNPTQGEPDQPVFSTLVEPGWVVGVARGMIPWFGALKLLLSGDAGMVPAQSWEWLAITLIGTLLAAMGIHYALRAEGIEDERRKADEEEEEDEREEEGRPPRRWRTLVPWRRSRDDDDADEEEEARPRPRRGRAPPVEVRRSGTDRRAHRGGRPRPSVGRRRARRHQPPSRSDEL